MVDQRWTSRMHHGEAPRRLDALFQGDEGPVAFRRFVSAAAQESRRRVMRVGVEVAGNCDLRLRLRVKESLGEQTGLQRLPFALERRHELALDLRAARSEPARRRDRNGARRAQMQIDDVERASVGKRDGSVEQGPVPSDLDRLRLGAIGVARRRPDPSRHNVVVDLPLRAHRPS